MDLISAVILVEHRFISPTHHIEGGTRLSDSTGNEVQYSKSQGFCKIDLH